MKKNIPKASEIFNNTNFLFAEKTTFEKAFPEIKDLKITVIESGTGIQEWNRKRVYDKKIGEYIDCSFSVCYNGGFSIGKILREMVSKKETKYKDECIFCKGYKGSPKGKRNYGGCSHFFNVEVEIEYNDSSK